MHHRQKTKRTFAKLGSPSIANAILKKNTSLVLKLLVDVYLFLFLYVSSSKMMPFKSQAH